MHPVSFDHYLTCLRVTDLCSRISFRLCWLSFTGAWLRFKAGVCGLRLSCRPSLGLRLSLFLSSSGGVGAWRYVCCGVGSRCEVSVGAGWDVSIRTWWYNSIGAGGGVRAGRVMGQRAHGRACDGGGRGACHWAANHGHSLHGHLLGLRDEDMTQ